jgi:hypothetical protein
MVRHRRQAGKSGETTGDNNNGHHHPMNHHDDDGDEVELSSRTDK